MGTNTKAIIPEDGILIKLDEVVIRCFTSSDSDISSLTKSADHPEVTKFLTKRFPSPYTRKDAMSYITMSLDPNSSNFAIAETNHGQVIGALDIKHHDDIFVCRKEIGYWITPEYWGRGIVTKAVREFAKWMFDKYEHLVTIHIKVVAGNKQSCRVAEKAGFKLEGTLRNSVVKNGVLYDEYIFGLLRSEV